MAMRGPEKSFELLDELERRQRKRLFTFSPNDALVQISLPLVLILAIATRLMIVSQSISAQDQGPVILDLWKQQLILRIDRVMEEWHDRSQLDAFPEFDRIQWGSGWPADTRFSQLCSQARELNRIPVLATNIYRQALQYRPESEEGDAQFAVLYDPLSPIAPPNADKIPEQFRITPERRAFAFDYISEKAISWRQKVESLQWAVVARCAAELPLEDELADAEIALQASKLAQGLQKKGYPLLESITSEYGSE